jgi:putative DNA methylase
MKPDGLLVFTFHHSRDEAWLAVRDALREAGLRVVVTHPIKAEMAIATPKSQAKEPINLDCIVVCRRVTAPGANGKGPVRWAGRATALIERFNRSGTLLSKGDIRVIVMGEFLRDASVRGASPALEEYVRAIPTLHASQYLARHDSVVRYEC